MGRSHLRHYWFWAQPVIKHEFRSSQGQELTEIAVEMLCCWRRVWKGSLDGWCVVGNLCRESAAGGVPAARGSRRLSLGGKLEPGARVQTHCFPLLAVTSLPVSTGKGFSKPLPLISCLLAAILCKFPTYPKGGMRDVPLWDVNPLCMVAGKWLWGVIILKCDLPVNRISLYYSAGIIEWKNSSLGQHK